MIYLCYHKELETGAMRMKRIDTAPKAMNCLEFSKFSSELEQKQFIEQGWRCMEYCEFFIRSQAAMEYG